LPCKLDDGRAGGTRTYRPQASISIDHRWSSSQHRISRQFSKLDRKQWLPKAFDELNVKQAYHYQLFFRFDRNGHGWPHY
jgi:hypothetical protein